jgi:hypothetical protein
MPKLIIAVSVLLTLAVASASTVNAKSQCYVVDGRSHYDASGDPVGKCSRRTAKTHYKLGKDLGIKPASAKCMGKPKGYTFIRWVGGQPRQVTCLGLVRS